MLKSSLDNKIIKYHDLTFVGATEHKLSTSSISDETRVNMKTNSLGQSYMYDLPVRILRPLSR